MANSDLDELLNALFSLAKHLLKKRHQFSPFGASMNERGEIAIAGSMPANLTPSPDDIIAPILRGFHEDVSNNTLRAVGICMDVRVIPPGESKKVDAICAQLEHQTGEAVNVFLPYRKKLFGSIEYGEVFGSPGERRIFSTQ